MKALAIAALLFCVSVQGAVKQEVVEMPQLCGPFAELQDIIVARGGKWIADGKIPTGKIYYFVNKKTGEVYIVHPIQGTHCISYDVVSDLRVNRPAAIGFLAD